MTTATKTRTLTTTPKVVETYQETDQHGRTWKVNRLETTNYWGPLGRMSDHVGVDRWTNLTGGKVLPNEMGDTRGFTNYDHPRTWDKDMKWVWGNTLRQGGQPPSGASAPQPTN